MTHHPSNPGRPTARLALTALSLGALFAATLGAAPVAAQTVERINVTTAGVESENEAFYGSVSDDGNRVAFDMWGFVTPQDNTSDIYLRDRTTGITTTVANGNGHSFRCHISGDGNFVAFYTGSNNLGPADINLNSDVYIYDVNAGTYYIASVNSAGIQPDLFGSDHPRLSTTGQHCVFVTSSTLFSQANVSPGQDMVVHDRGTGLTTLINESFAGGSTSNGTAIWPDISGDGRYVAFESPATDLLAAPTNGRNHIFVRDRDSDNDGIFDEAGAMTTILISKNAAGVEADHNNSYPTISNDGRFVAFTSVAGNLVGNGFGQAHIYLHDRDTDEDGIYDEPGAHNVTRVSVSSLGVDANIGVWAPQISGDGTKIAFYSTSRTLTRNSTAFNDVYVHDRVTGQTRLVSTDATGAHGNGSSGGLTANSRPGVDLDGDTIAFRDASTNLVAGDTNGRADIFVKEMCTNPAIDLGFSKPRPNTEKPDLSVCGAIGGGFNSELRLRFAPPLAGSLLLVDLNQAPVPGFGGTIVPAFPIDFTVFLVTNANGDVTLPTNGNGSGGPNALDVYLQWLVFDNTDPEGIALSNALEVEILP